MDEKLVKMKREKKEGSGGGPVRRRLSTNLFYCSISLFLYNILLFQFNIRYLIQCVILDYFMLVTIP